MAGRPTKRTPDREERLLSALRDGNTRRAACAHAGISEDSLSRWLHASADFAESVKRAEGEAEVRHVGTISRAAHRGNWTAAAWWLERRRPQEWGKTLKVDIEARIRVIAEQLGLDPDEAVASAERLLREARVAPSG